MSGYVPTPNYALVGNYWMAAYWQPWYWVGGPLPEAEAVEAQPRGFAATVQQRLFGSEAQPRGFSTVVEDRP